MNQGGIRTVHRLVQKEAAMMLSITEATVETKIAREPTGKANGTLAKQRQRENEAPSVSKNVQAKSWQKSRTMVERGLNLRLHVEAEDDQYWNYEEEIMAYIRRKLFDALHIAPSQSSGLNGYQGVFSLNQDNISPIAEMAEVERKCLMVPMKSLHFSRAYVSWSLFFIMDHVRLF